MTQHKTQNHLILGLDPSSTICGYAVKNCNNLIEAGVITPEDRAGGSFERIRSMRRDLINILTHFQPSIILVEWTKGKVNIRRHHGLGAGLAVYGCGVGAIATECDHWQQHNTYCEVIAINENDWTRHIKKSERQLAVASRYPQYRVEGDPGGDIADAIGIIDWWKQENLMRKESNVRKIN